MENESNGEKCVFIKDTGHIIIRASKDLVAVLLLTYSLWRDNFTCFPVSGANSTPLIRLSQYNLCDKLTPSGIADAMTTTTSSCHVNPSDHGVALEIKEFKKMVHDAGLNIGDLKSASFLFLVPLMKGNPKWEEWERDGEAQRFKGLVGCDKGGFCFTKLRSELKGEDTPNIT